MLGELIGLGLMGASVMLDSTESNHRIGVEKNASQFKSDLSRLRDSLRHVTGPKRGRYCRRAHEAIVRASESFRAMSEHLFSMDAPEYMLDDRRIAFKQLLDTEVRAFGRRCGFTPTGLSGAVKVCLAYKMEKDRLGRRQCAQWGTGPGYTEGPYSVTNYYIPEVREAAGIKRKYRYRTGLPYPPIEYGSKARGRTGVKAWGAEEAPGSNADGAIAPPRGFDARKAIPGQVRIVELGPSKTYSAQMARQRQDALMKASEAAKPKEKPVETEEKPAEPKKKRTRKKKGE